MSAHIPAMPALMRLLVSHASNSAVLTGRDIVAKIDAILSG
jgi:hypothetical protein